MLLGWVGVHTACMQVAQCSAWQCMAHVAGLYGRMPCHDGLLRPITQMTRTVVLAAIEPHVRNAGAPNGGGGSEVTCAMHDAHAHIHAR